MGRKADFGDNHGRDNAFKLLTPYGDFNFKSFGELSSPNKYFKTADGKFHFSGGTDSIEVAAEMYNTNKAEVAAIDLWANACRQALPGSKVPGTLVTYGPGDRIVESQFIEQIGIADLKQSAKDMENHKATTTTVQFVVYNAKRVM
jgi:hypothetical protein